MPLLLVRLATDGPKVGKRVAALLVNSFFPQGKSAEVLVRRFGARARAGRAAAAAVLTA